MQQFVFLISSAVLMQIAAGKTQDSRYLPNWDSLDTRPLPGWFDEAKIGIFLHWGVFSVPSFGSEWFWSSWEGNSSDYVEFMNKNYPKDFTYQEFAKEFTAEFFNPDDWADLFAKSGAKYIVLTSKHHEGYTLWPSKYSFSWNAKDVGPHRDLIGDLARAVRNKNLTFGLYHSLYEWFNPIYQSDKLSNFVEKDFVTNKILPEMRELVENYQPSVLWSDGDWEAPDTYWNSTDFLAWLYNDSPVKDVVVVNDRWGIDIPCKHGDFYSCQDRYNPGTLQPHKWENAMTIDKVSWGFRRNAKLSDFLSTHELITTLAQTVSCGGNLLMNVGPTKDGIIAPIFEERLLDLGQWLSINGEAIYKSTPWTAQNDSSTPDVWYTTKESAVFAIVLNWPIGDVLLLESPVKALKKKTIEIDVITMLGSDEELKFQINEDSLMVNFPNKASVKNNWAWVLKMSSSAANVNLV